MRRILRSAGIAAFSLILAPQWCHAASSVSTPIDHALGIYITPRGQKYFNHHLQEALFRMRDGTDLNDGGIESWQYEAKEPIDLNHLPIAYQQFSTTLGKIRDALTQWLKGFSLNNPRFSADFTNIEYTANFSKMGLFVDPDATVSLGTGRGIILNLIAEIVPDLRIQADTLQAQDLDNPFLKFFGATQLWAKLESGPPLQIKSQLSLIINDRDEVEFEMLNFETNLKDVNFDIGYTTPLALPRVQVTVNNHKTGNLKQDKVEKVIQEHKATLTKALQTYLGELAPLSIPEAVNASVHAHWKAPLSEINQMDPPAAGEHEIDVNDKYLWGTKAEEIQLTPQYLFLGLSAFIDDPRSPQPWAEVSREIRNRAPVLQTNPATYDAALAINQNLLNRLLGLGFARGFKSLKTIPVDGSKPLKILEAPEFKFEGGLNKNRGKFHIKVEHEADGFSENLAFRKNLSFEMDILARLIITQDGQSSIVLDGIDLNSLQIDLKSVRGLFESSVKNGLRDKLVAANAELRKKPKTIVDSLFRSPVTIRGIPMKLRGFQADPNGYLVLYFNYDFEQ
ncbi:hypothetical protein WDW37_06220 [Bdellovibrionota bacterium FG-1]